MFKGLTRGIQQIVDLLALTLFLFEKSRYDEIREHIVPIVKQWISEVSDVKGLVKSNLIFGLVLNKDPFSTSHSWWLELLTANPEYDLRKAK